MKSIFIFLRNVKNLLPYLILIAIYFFFVNLEAKKNINNSQQKKIEQSIKNNKNILDGKQKRLIIPVVPYKN